VTVKLKEYLQPLQSTKLGAVQRCPYAPAMHASHRWGVVLADGDGGRLRELTQRVWGNRPKQFCPILSGCTLLEATRRRAERIIPCEQILFSVIQAHERYYFSSLGHGPSLRLVQPFNKGTAPAILLPLFQIAHADADAIVSILPSDHYYSPESAFTVALESALAIVEPRASSLA
jgi:mannose-1-phosphate guanylyltransferase